MGYNVNKMKERAEELALGYEDARDEAFNSEFQEQFFSRIHNDDDENNDYLVPTLEIFTEDDIQGFLDSFTFPEENEWAYEQVQSELDDIGDQKYQEMKDERCCNED